ncbi:CRAL-TRIO domain-containing protein [Neolecta irregularis DAH-3]|uniref:CRAL-TRIO domain-containing protein n=1 Tax=Neolecta irregularis (strain DAH-3) TaxID=1198029 RepID=A0A1U7LJB9_NEOID|nr:CRAL-TRIO domain-containing protein [Neolecta irregularis DAH-3]|eukprot:OLL22621.1 CRAL-TRIO domain-containing protein [Neolecta irregularis DAH-3]
MSTPLLLGRPRSLSSSQEQCLKDMWAAVFILFSTVEPINGEHNNIFTDKKDLRKHKLKLAALLNKKSAVVVDPAQDKYSLTKDMRDDLANKDPKDLRAAFWNFVKLENPDTWLLRFLRARKWDVHRAFVMLLSTIHWRTSEMCYPKVDRLAAEGEEYFFLNNDEEFIKQLQSGKAFMYGSDKEGRPLSYIKPRLHFPAHQSLETMQKFTSFYMETAIFFLNDYVDQGCMVVDITGFSLANLDLPVAKFMIKCLETYYPECLGICLIHNAPWWFQGIWNIIKGLLDPEFASKLHFTRTTADLEKFISADQLIQEFGGNNQFVYTYVDPVAGENNLMKETQQRDAILAERDERITKLERTTQSWIAADENDDQDKLKEQRYELMKQFREDYFRFDPYIRARSLYDRTGAINVEAASYLNTGGSKTSSAEIQ